MLGSTVLEVAIGLTFCYATVALIVSTIQEAIASALQLRARTLLGGVKSMLNDPKFQSLARELYAHALVNPHHNGSRGAHPLKARPSYIEPVHFAGALIDIIQTVPGDFDQLGRDIEALPDPQLRQALRGIYQRSHGTIEVFEAAVAGWFDSAMERVSGVYKRLSMVVSLLLSLLIAVLFNIDSVHLFQALWQQPALTSHVGIASDPRTIEALWRLPIGWEHFPPTLDSQFAVSVAGWLLTASTAMFGAPFWFDLMKRTVQLRGTGARP